MSKGIAFEGKNFKIPSDFRSYRIIYTGSGRHLCTVVSNVILSKKEILMIASDGLYDHECDSYTIYGWEYSADCLQITENDIDRLKCIEKIAMLKDNGMSTYDAEKCVMNGNMIIYDDNDLGFEEFKSNMTDVDTDEIETEWLRLVQMNRIDELGNIIGNYRVEFFS